MSNKNCSVDGCDRPCYARGMCLKHYKRWWRHGDTGDHLKKRGRCSVPGCSNPHVAKGFCRKHYSRMYNHGTLEVTKDMSGRRKRYFEEYQIWMDIKQRCYNQNQAGYEYYGGRGIKVCDRWLEKPDGFKNFLEDMGRRPSGKEAGGKSLYSIDRIDPDGDYSPENCRWVERDVQANNKRSSVLITINGETKTLTQWARIYNIGAPTVFSRYNRGWRGEKLFSPVQ